jgi:hypothetical protein
MLVLIGATPEGKKELLGFQVGVRESAQSWRELLVDLKARGLVIAPELATGDGALGFWKALDAVSPTTRHQRCTLHKTANVLNKMPKSVQPAAKADLREVWAAPDRATAEAVVATFAEKYGAKYEKAVTCLVKDRDALLTFYDFPAHGVQAGDGRLEDLAPAERREPVAQGRRGCHLPQRRRGHQHDSTERRLITASPKSRHSSPLTQQAAQLRISLSTHPRNHDFADNHRCGLFACPCAHDLQRCNKAWTTWS